MCERVETSNYRHPARLEHRSRQSQREREQLKLAVEKFVTDSLAAIFREHAKRIPISEGVCVCYSYTRKHDARQSTKVSARTNFYFWTERETLCLVVI